MNPSPLSYETWVSPGPTSRQTLPDGSAFDWSPTTTTLILGRTQAALVDPPFLDTQLEDVAHWVDAHEQRVAFIYITHGHGDHWFGPPALAQRLGGIPVYATPGTIAQLPDAGSARARAFYENLYPGRVASADLDPQPIPAAGLDIEGHPLEVVEVGHSDGDDSTVLYVPDIGLVVAGDVAYNNVHQFLAEGRDGGLDRWSAAIEKVRELRPEAVVAGHKDSRRSDSPSILDETAEYLRTASELLRRGATRESFVRDLVTAYPDRINPSVPWVSAQRLIDG